VSSRFTVYLSILSSPLFSILIVLITRIWTYREEKEMNACVNLSTLSQQCVRPKVWHCPISQLQKKYTTSTSILYVQSKRITRNRRCNTNVECCENEVCNGITNEQCGTMHLVPSLTFSTTRDVIVTTTEFQSRAKVQTRHMLSRTSYVMFLEPWSAS
jgi:hypothetical protein